jgi:hypothetical protein
MWILRMHSLQCARSRCGSRVLDEPRDGIGK